MMVARGRHFILRIESYEGRDTYIRCGDDERDFVYGVGRLDADGTAEIVDCGYRTFEEAAEAWPEARPKAGDAARIRKR
jgi:hypothetical protein